MSKSTLTTKSKAVPRTLRQADAPRVAVIVSRYNHSITEPLLAGAMACYSARYRSDPHVYPAPGAYELPFLAAAAASSGRYDGVVALGCVIRGETRHDRYINHAVAQSIAGAALATGVPIAFGVLTVENAKQARERAGGKHGNKGSEAMQALLDTLSTRDAIHAGRATEPRAIFSQSSKDKASKRRAAVTSNGAAHGQPA